MTKNAPSWGDPRFTVQVIDIDNKKVLHAQKLCREVFTDSSNEDSADQSERKPNKQHHMEQKLAKHLKHNFEKSYGGVWHCVVGTSYGAFVTQRKGHFLYFFVDNMAVMLYRSA